MAETGECEQRWVKNRTLPGQQEAFLYCKDPVDVCMYTPLLNMHNMHADFNHEEHTNKMSGKNDKGKTI